MLVVQCDHYSTVLLSLCKALAKRTRKSTQADASWQNQNLRTDSARRWPKGFASRLTSSCMWQKDVNCMHI